MSGHIRSSCQATGAERLPSFCLLQRPFYVKLRNINLFQTETKNELIDVAKYLKPAVVFSCGER